MASTYYYSANGQIFAEDTAGQSRLDYISVVQGSVIGLVDQAGAAKGG